MTAWRRIFCKHNGSWTYDKHNPTIRVCLECGWKDHGWKKQRGEWIQQWTIQNRQ